jgi:hypothetical protein
MLSRPLNIENNNQHNLPMIPQNVKRTTATGGILLPTQNLPINSINNEKQIDTIKRTIIQDDIENIQERLNEMLIAVPSTNENDNKHLLTQQKSTTEYFTPKISIEENRIDDDDDLDRNLFFFRFFFSTLILFLAIIHGIESTTHPFFDVLTTTTYEKEVMKYLLSLETRFMNENDKLRSEKHLRESTNTLKPVEGIPTPGCHSIVVITPKVRCKLIDWIISVHDYHRLNAG